VLRSIENLSLLRMGYTLGYSDAILIYYIVVTK
jgi:hypothetical protein